MKVNPLKKALAENKQTYGTWLTLAHPLMPEILALGGFDWVVVDMEHSSIELNDLLLLLISIEANNMVPLVRVGENNSNLIKRVMDAGAYGVIVPNVKTAKEAQAAVNAVKYPPFGTRGVGLYRAQKFGRKFEDYKKWLSEESLVIIQIEHIDAVQQIDDIFTTPGLDAYLIGPYDLSGSLGRPGDFADPEFVSALQVIRDAALRHKIPAGIHSVSTDPEEARARRREGYIFLAFSVDTIFLGDMVTQSMLALKEKL